MSVTRPWFGIPIGTQAAKLSNMEIGVATIPDAMSFWLSLTYEGDESDAEFITQFGLRPTHGGKLLLNVDGVAPNAPLAVELLDDHDMPLPGFSGDDAAQITANGTQQVITWPKSKSAALPATQPLEVRIHWPDHSSAKVFALYVTE